MSALTPLMAAYILTLAAVFGLIMGSFLNCAALRAVRGESVAKGRSRCPDCGHTLAARDLIPVFSRLFLKGKCRYCGARIPFRYTLAELFTAALYISVLLKFGISLKTLEYLVLASVLIGVFFSDLEAYTIPDRFILAGIIGRIVFILLSDDTGGEALSSLIGGLSISLPLLLIVLVMDKILKKETMGGGDIKLLFMTGIYLKWKFNFIALIFSCVIGIIFGLCTMKKRAAGQKPIPFGPAIVCGTWLSLIFGELLLSWYLGLFV